MHGRSAQRSHFPSSNFPEPTIFCWETSLTPKNSTRGFPWSWGKFGGFRMTPIENCTGVYLVLFYLREGVLCSVGNIFNFNMHAGRCPEAWFLGWATSAGVPWVFVSVDMYVCIFFLFSFHCFI